MFALWGTTYLFWSVQSIWLKNITQKRQQRTLIFIIHIIIILLHHRSWVKVHGMVERNQKNNHHHHHHVALVARISLVLSRHTSLSFIALGRSSGQHPVSSHSCWMYVLAGRPAFARPCVGSIRVHILWVRPCFSGSVLHVWFKRTITTTIKDKTINNWYFFLLFSLSTWFFFSFNDSSWWLGILFTNLIFSTIFI